MTDGQILFAVLAIIYVSDCLLWIPKDSIAFVTWWGRNWKWKNASQYLGTSKSGLLFLNVLPPFGKAVCSYTLPLSMSPLGICQFASQTLHGSARLEYTGKVILFNKMQSIIRRNRDLFINDNLFCKFHSTEQAQLVESLLIILLQNSVETRTSYLEQFWQRQLNLKMANRTFKSIWTKLDTLRGLCISLFLFIFAFVPVMAFVYGLSRILIGSAITMYMMAAIIAYAFYRLHKKLCPLDLEDRIANVITMILCPPVAIRACDLFAKSIMAKFHPLTTAHACLAKAQFINFADMIIRDMRYPFSFQLEEFHAVEICQWHNEFILSIAERSLQNNHKLIDRLAKPPVREDESILTYCPRCLCQFQLNQGTCPDCLGVKLIPFVKSKNNADRGQ